MPRKPEQSVVVEDPETRVYVPPLHESVQEAIYRLRVVLWMVNEFIEKSAPAPVESEDEDTGGYEAAILREAIETVIGQLAESYAKDAKRAQAAKATAVAQNVGGAR